MKRVLWSLLILIVLGSIGYVVYRTDKRLTRMNARLDEMNLRVVEATQVAKEEAVATSAASQRATEAAARAEIAANGRATAEQMSERAKAGQAEAETAAQQAQTAAQQAKTQLITIRKQREEELNQMQEALNRVVETRRTSNGMVMVLPDSVFKFGFDSADLSPHNRELLSRISGILLVSKGYGLSIFGYTDDVGSSDYNLKLSGQRADAVRDYLVRAGIDKSIVNTKGYGKANPLVKGTSDTARSKNRRVEIALTDSEIKYLGEAQ